jgi:hypothetical protein
MTTDRPQHEADLLDAYWADLLRGVAAPAPAGLDPALADLARQLVDELGAEPRPQFTDRLQQQVDELAAARSKLSRRRHASADGAPPDAPNGHLLSALWSGLSWCFGVPKLLAFAAMVALLLIVFHGDIGGAMAATSRRLDALFGQPVVIAIGNAEVCVKDAQPCTMAEPDKWQDEYIGILDVRAAVGLLNMARDLGFLPKEYRLVDAKQFADEMGAPKDPPSTGAILSVGGPNANPVSLYYLARLRGIRDAEDVAAASSGFKFVTRNPDENAFSEMVDQGPIGIEDMASGELCPYDEAQGLDCALVVIGRDPETDVTIAIFAGYGATATLAATEAMTAEASPIFAEIRRVFDELGYAEAVISVRGGQAELFDFPSAANPRGRE